MRRILQALILAATAVTTAPPAQAWIAQKATATTSFLLYSQSNAASPNNADRYFGVGYATAAAIADYKSMVFPIAGRITGIRFYTATTNTTSGATWTGTVVLNGVSSAATCTITLGGAQCSASPNVTVAAGDTASLLVHPSTGTIPSANSFISAVITFTPTNLNDTFLVAQNSAFSTTSTFSTNMFSNAAAGAASARRSSILPDAGTIDNLRVVATAPGGSGGGYTYTTMKLGSATTATCPITDPATTCSDTTHSFSASAGDDIAFQAAPSAGPAPATTIAAFGARFVPATTAAFPIVGAGGQNTADSATLTTYYPLVSGLTVGGTTETNYQTVTEIMTVTGMRVKLSVAPGSGKNRLLTLRKNGVDTGIAVTVADTATTGSATGTVTFAAGDIASISDVPSAGSPTAATPSISFLATR